MSASKGDMPVALTFAALYVNSAKGNSHTHCSGRDSCAIYAFKNISRVAFAFSTGPSDCGW
jgi:hypothetical protein